MRPLGSRDMCSYSWISNKLLARVAKAALTIGPTINSFKSAPPTKIAGPIEYPAPISANPKTNATAKTPPLAFRLYRCHCCSRRPDK